MSEEEEHARDWRIFNNGAESRDAEIERLKKELAHETDMAAQADMFVNRYKSLITELADELDRWEQSEGFLWDAFLKVKVKALGVESHTGSEK